MLGHKRLEMTMHYVQIAGPETYKSVAMMVKLLNDILEGVRKAPHSLKRGLKRGLNINHNALPHLRIVGLQEVDVQTVWQLRRIPD